MKSGEKNGTKMTLLLLCTLHNLYKEETDMTVSHHKSSTCLPAIMLCAALLILPLVSLVLPTAADEDKVVYLGDMEDKLTSFAALEDRIGFNSAHSGEPCTIGSRSYDKGLGMHCLPDRNAYMEFDISSYGAHWFAAEVGLLKDAAYFMEWGSASFYVYGDGELLASSPVVLWGEEPYTIICDVTGVKTLRLEQNNEGGYSCDACIWGGARLTAQKPIEQETEAPTMNPDKTNEPQPADMTSGDYAYISDLYWVNSDTLSGNKPMRDANTCNEEIWTADGRFFEKGIGLHAKSGAYDSCVEVNIEGLGYTKLATYLGVCETLSSYDITMAQVQFAVFADGNKLFESGVMHYGEPMQYIEVDVTGAKVVKLAILSPGGAISGAWGTWGGTLLSKSGDVEALFEVVTEVPTDVPTEAPTDAPTESPTDAVTEAPSDTVTEGPTEAESGTEPASASSATEPVTEPTQKSGCSSSLTGLWTSAALLLTAAAGFCALAVRRKGRG